MEKHQTNMKMFIFGRSLQCQIFLYGNIFRFGTANMTQHTPTLLLVFQQQNAPGVSFLASVLTELVPEEPEDILR